MTTQEALRIVQSALNERKALAKLEEALASVADSERVVAELKIEADGLRDVIANLKSMKIDAEGDLEEVKAEAEARVVQARAAFDEEALVWAGKVAEIEAYVKGHEQKVAEAEADYAARIKELDSIVYKLRSEADAEEARIEAAQKAMAQIKAVL